MTQEQRLDFLLPILAHEQGRPCPRPATLAEKAQCFRALCNVRPPAPADEDFLRLQDAYLSQAIQEKGVTPFAALSPLAEQMYLWRGDITTLQVDAIVNAANAQMRGCFVPCHGCIDNAIHTFAGVQLRLACDALMQTLGRPARTGEAFLTPAFNLPSRYVLHTVGPVVDGPLTDVHRRQLASCYRACLSLAREQGLTSVAFCCISTGVYRFPPAEAARIAVQTVRAFCRERPGLHVVFNVFTQTDEALYRALLQKGDGQ